MFSHVIRVRRTFPWAEAELREDGAEGQPDEWVILSERGRNAAILGRGKSMPEAWADAARNLRGVEN